MQEKDKEQVNKEEKRQVRTKRSVKLSRIKRKILKHVWLVRIAIVGVILALIYGLLVVLGNFLGGLGISTYATLAKDFIFTPESKIESIEGRTNILVLGKGGKEHEAPDLTDTVIFASVSHQKGGVGLISLPRDIWIPELRAKLNSAYYWGNQREEGGGMVLAKATVEEIVGQPVHYGVVVDFSGFKELVDVLGGIEVDVEKGFVDERYPIPGKEEADCNGDPNFDCRYETVRFEEGLQMMDGNTALKFVRSRHAEGEEGTDIARARRQQKVLSSLQGKILSPSVLLSPSKINRLFDVAEETIETDMPLSAGAILARRALQARGNIDSHVLDGGYLENPPISPQYDNLYVFVPVDETWESVHEWVESLLP